MSELDANDAPIAAWEERARKAEVGMARLRLIAESAYRCAEWLQYGRTAETDATMEELAAMSEAPEVQP